MRTVVYLLLPTLSLMGVQAATIANGLASRRSGDLGLTLRQIHNADFNSGSTTVESHGDHHGEHSHMGLRAISAPPILSSSVADSNGNVLYTGDIRRNIDSLSFARQAEELDLVQTKFGQLTAAAETSSSALARRQLPDLADIPNALSTLDTSNLSGLTTPTLTDEQLSALDQTTPTDPRTFAFFKGLNDAATPPLSASSAAVTAPATDATAPPDVTSAATDANATPRESQPFRDRLNRRQDIDSLRNIAEEDIAEEIDNTAGPSSLDPTPSLNRMPISRRAWSITSSVNGNQPIDEKIPNDMDAATGEVSQDLEDVFKTSHSTDYPDMSLTRPSFIAVGRRQDVPALEESLLGQDLINSLTA